MTTLAVLLGGALLVTLLIALSNARRPARRTHDGATSDGYGGDVSWMSGGSDSGGDCGSSDAGGCAGGGGDGGGGGD